MRVPEDPKAVAIANVTPDVDRGRYAVKRVVGDAVRVEADVFTHGHDELAVRLEYRERGRARLERRRDGGAGKRPLAR